MVDWVMHYRETDKQDYLCRCFFLLTVANILACTSGLVCHQKGWWKMGKGPPLTHKRAVSYLPLLPICHLTFCLFVILILLPLQLFTHNLVSYHFSLLLQPPILIIHMRAVRKVSSHFEYLENRSRGLDVT